MNYKLIIFVASIFLLMVGNHDVFAKKFPKGTFLYYEESQTYAYIHPKDSQEKDLGGKEQLGSSLLSFTYKATPKNVLHIPLSALLFDYKGTDSDKDGLSNEFEKCIGTQVLKNDSDGDGYPDKHELLNSYSPLSKQKKKIPLVKKPLKVFVPGYVYACTKGSGIFFVNPRNSRLTFFENSSAFENSIQKIAKHIVVPVSLPSVSVTPVANSNVATPTPSVSPVPTPQLTPSPTSTPSPKPITTSSPLPSPTSTPLPSPTSTPVVTPSVTPAPSPTVSPISTPSPTPIPVVVDDTEPPRDESKIECDTTADQFREVGAIKCGRILWKLSSENAKLFKEDPRGYFMKYDDLYYFYKDFMGGHEPWQEMITVLEDPNLTYPATANYVDSTINVSPLFVKEQFVYLAQMPSKPLNPSFMHEIGHIFGLTAKTKNAYIWKDLTEGHANMVGILPYLMAYDGQFKMTVDFWCRNKLKTTWPCNAYFKDFEMYPEWLGANKDLEEYQKNNETFDTLFVKPPQDQSIHERGGKFQTMLTTLYTEFKQKGKGKEFYEGYKKAQQFYIINPAVLPEKWKSDSWYDDSSTTIKKMNTYLLLLSIYTKTDFLDRFEKEWRFPILPETKTAYTKAAQGLFSDQKILDVMKEFLSQ